MYSVCIFQVLTNDKPLFMNFHRNVTLLPHHILSSSSHGCISVNGCLFSHIKNHLEVFCKAVLQDTSWHVSRTRAFRMPPVSLNNLPKD